MTTVLDDLLFRIIVRKEASAEANVNKFIVQIKKVQGELNKTTRSQKKLSAAQRAAKSVMKGLTGTVGRLVTALGGFLILRRLIRLTTEFETKIAEMATVISGSEAKVAGMRREIIELSRVVPQSASELTAGAYAIFSAQILDAAEALVVLTASSKAAVGGLTDTKTAAEAIAGVINAYGLAASDATRISDILFQTVELGQIKFKQLSVEIGTALTSAALAGVTFEELSAAIATMTLRQIAAAETTTSLNRLFIALTRQTPAQIEALKRVGLEFNVAAVREKGFIEVIKELNRLTKGQLDSLSELFPNIRAARSVFVLAGKGIDQYTIALEKMNTGSGAAERAFNKLAGTTNNVAKLLRNNFNAVILELSESILPAAVTAMEFFIDVLDRLRFRSLLSPAFVASIETLSGVAEGLPVSKVRFTPAQRTKLAKDLTENMSKLVGISEAFNLSLIRGASNLGRLADSVKKLSDEELLALQRGAAALTLDSLGLDEKFRQQVGKTLTVINQEIQRRPELLEFLRTGATQRRVVEIEEDEELINIQQLARRRALAEELARFVSSLAVSTAQRQIDAIEVFREKMEEEYGGRIPEAAEDGFRRIEAAAQKALRVEEAKRLAGEYREALEVGLRDIELDLFQRILTEEDRTALSIEQQTTLLEQKKLAIEENLRATGLTIETEEELRKVLVEILRLMKGITDEQQAAADAAARLNREKFRELQLQLNLISQAVNGVVELAEAFGLVSSETADILDNLNQIGIGAANIAAGIAASNPLAIGAGVSSLAGGLAGVGAALFGGETDAERKQREAQEANTRAIELLTTELSIQAQVFGQFTGEELRRAKALVRILPFRKPGEQLESLTAANRDLIERLARSLGITLDDTRQSFRDLQAALENLDLSLLVKEFGFALDLLEKRFQVFDIEDPLEQLQALIEFGQERGFIGPGAFDLTTAEGRKFFDNFLRTIFERIEAGTFAVPLGFTLPDFIVFLVRLEGLLDQVQEDLGDTQQFAINRTITEVTGSRIAALLFGIQFETKRIADNSDLMVAILNQIAGNSPMGAPRTTHTLPGIPGIGTASVSVQIGSIDVGVRVVGSFDSGSPIEIGRAIGASVVDEIDSKLGERLREASRLAGEIILQ